jgi:hypothetical protein
MDKSLKKITKYLLVAFIPLSIIYLLSLINLGTKSVYVANTFRNTETELSLAAQVDAAQREQANAELQNCPQCTVTWVKSHQGVRITLVDKTTGTRIKGTRSVDYSNEHADTSFISSIYFHGYNSKLDYISGVASPSLRSGYSVLKPIGSLPRLVSENKTDIGSINAYLKNTFVNFDGYPTNLLRLLRDVGEDKTTFSGKPLGIAGGGSSNPIGISGVKNLYQYLLYFYDNMSDYGVELELTTNQWVEIEGLFNYAFIVEPVVYFKARTGLLAPTYLINGGTDYAGRTFAVTATEAAYIFPNSHKDCLAGVCYSVTHTILPTSIYLDGSVQNIYFEGSRAQYSEAVGFAGSTGIRFDKNKTSLTPYLLYTDVVGTLNNSPGLGIGYFDLVAQIRARCQTDKCGDPEPETPKCTIDDLGPKPDVPFCNTGSCGSTIAMSDDTNWNNVIGNSKLLDSSLGSLYKVTNWIRSNDIFDYRNMNCTEVGDVSFLAPVYCRHSATSSFPVTGSSSYYYAGTHFTFDPIRFDISKECKTTIETDKWEKDYTETEKRLSIAKGSLARALTLNNIWKDINASSLDRYDSGSILSGSATLNGGTYCNLVQEPSTSFAASDTTACPTYVGSGLLPADRANSTRLTRGATVAVPTALNQYKQVLSGSTCTNSKSRAKKILIDDGILVDDGFEWIVEGTATATTTYTCTYLSATATTSRPNSSWVGDQNREGSYYVSLSGGRCTPYTNVGVGDKWTSWSYRFDSGVLDDFIEYNRLDGRTSYVIDTTWPLTTEKDVAICKGAGDYQTTVDKYTEAVQFYEKRLVDLKNELPRAVNWNVNTSSPSISVIHKQSITTSKDPFEVEYDLSPEIIATTLPDGIKESKKVVCNTTACGNIKAITGLTEIYSSIYDSKNTNYKYSLPTNTNRYILKPSGEVASSLTGYYLTSGNYIDIEYPNYAISPNSLTGFGSGSITLEYTGIGQNNHLGRACGTPLYTCDYSTKKIPDCVGDGCDPTPKGFNYVYRTIDLNNPFPFTDGTNRQPGYNWRAIPNTVENVITNNRGVTTDNVYNLAPMYSFDFTGANRLKLVEIRNYNKSYKFKNFEGNITCKFGRECRSAFLSSNIFTNVIKGCGTVKDNFFACNKGV